MTRDAKAALKHHPLMDNGLDTEENRRRVIQEFFKEVIEHAEYIAEGNEWCSIGWCCGDPNMEKFKKGLLKKLKSAVRIHLLGKD